MDAKKNVKEEMSIVRGTFYGSLGVFSRIVFLFLANLILARCMGARDYGIWALNFIIITLGYGIVFLGLERGIGRFIGKCRGSKEYGKITIIISDGIVLIFLASFLVTSAVFFASSFFAAFFKISEISMTLKITALTFFPAAVIEIIGSIFQGFEDIKKARVVNSFIPNFLFFSAIVLLWVFGKIDLFSVSVLYAVSFWLAGIVSMFFLIRLYPDENILKSIGLALIRKSGHKIMLLRFSLPLLFYNIITNVGIYADSFIIGYFLSAYKLGIYSIASRIARMSLFLLLGSFDIFSPLISKNLADTSNKEFNTADAYFRSTKWLFAGTLLIIITLMVFPSFFIGWFGKEFLEGSFALRLLLISFLISAFAGPTDSVNIALGNTKFVAFYSILGFLISASLCISVIPYFGIEGAAAVSIISAIVTNGIPLLKLKIVNNINIINWKYVKFASFSVFIGLALGFCIRNFFSAGLAGVAVFTCLFGLIEFIFLDRLKLIDEKDLEIGKILKLKVFSILK